MRKIPFAKDEYYHLYNRGVNKMPIFNDEKDKKRFQKLLYLCNIRNSPKLSDLETSSSPNRVWTLENKDTLVDIGAYCLMSNHFHILIRVKDPADASAFIQKLLVSYSKYFNKKYDRSGVLFQGKTQSEHLSTDEYLKYLYAYIHLNPVKLIDSKWKEEGLKDLGKTLNFLNSYHYSSFLDYSGTNRQEGKILNEPAFPEYFPNPKDNLSEITEWLNYGKNL